MLRAIACYKFLKALVVAAAGLGALRLLDPAVAAWAARWAAAIPLRHGGRALRHVLEAVVGLRPRRLEEVALGAFLFATLFVVEGVGLWLGKRWAEYLTVVATTGLIPLEIVYLAHRVTVGRAATLVLNVLVVAVLVWQLRRQETR